MGPDLAKQFSLDYLISGSRSGESSARPESAPEKPDAVFQMLSQPIVRKLADAPDRSLHMFDLSDQLAEVYGDIQCEGLSEIVRRLESAGLIQILERHRHGNHLLQLVDK
jgi:hypothetical protein